MRNDCDCQYCKNNVNEYFCIKCLHNFNNCESFFEFKDEKYGSAPVGIQLCPHCHPEDWQPESYIEKKYVFKKLSINTVYLEYSPVNRHLKNALHKRLSK